MTHVPGFNQAPINNVSRREEDVATAIAYARRLRSPIKRFAYELRVDLRLASLSRQMIYKWENEEARVPASVLIAAARLCSLSVDDLLRISRSKMERHGR
jgi:hypothetical protein